MFFLVQGTLDIDVSILLTHAAPIPVSMDTVYQETLTGHVPVTLASLESRK